MLNIAIQAVQEAAHAIMQVYQQDSIDVLLNDLLRSEHESA